MEWAYLLHDEFEYHFMNIGIFDMFVDSYDNSVTLKLIENMETDKMLFKLHGGFMWAAWGLISVI